VITVGSVGLKGVCQYSLVELDHSCAVEPEHDLNLNVKSAYRGCGAANCAVHGVKPSQLHVRCLNAIGSTNTRSIAAASFY